MSKGIFVLVLLLSLGSINAQNVVKKSVRNPENSSVFIDSNNCFKVELSTARSSEIVVEALLDGEYKDDLLVKIEDGGQSIGISAGFQPNFVKPNDKLSAHKVISISMRIQVPHDMSVGLLGSCTNVYATGTYKELKITLDDGTCKLNGVKGNTHSLTRNGDIFVFSNEAIIETKSKFGKIEGESIPTGDDYFNLATTTGNIYLKKTE